MNNFLFKLFITVFLIVLTSNSISQNWTIVHFSRPLSSVNFLTQNTGWIFDGDIGYRTTNGGISWGLPKLLNNPCPTYYYYPRKFYFVDSLYGWSACQDINISRTTDGGNYWSTCFVAYVTITDIFFINRSTGWAIANEGNSPYPTIYKSTNSGVNWFSQSITGNKPLLSIFMNDSNKGWVGMDSGKVAVTTNGGSLWNILDFSTYKKVNVIYFKNSNFGWIWLNPGSILKTTNGGANWISYNLPYEYEMVSSVFFRDTLKGWTVSSWCHILNTTNGGINWSIQMNQGSSSFTSIFFKDQNTGFAVSSDGQILITSDMGNDWSLKNIPLSENIRSTYFNNVNTGWIVSNEGRIYKTVNSGINWNMVYDSYFYHFSSIYFSNDLVGWISADSGNILKTIDGGNTWTYYKDSSYTFNSVSFTDLQNGWAVGNGGVIAHSSNGGINWINNNILTNKDLKSVNFVNISTGFIAGTGHSIYRTTNSGMNWIPISPSDTLNYTSVKFINENTGYLTGYYLVYQNYTPYTRRYVYKTTNSGNGWGISYYEQISSTPGEYPFTSIDAFNMYVCVAASNATIYQSSNGGINWSYNVSPALSFAGYNDVFMLNEQYAWAVGNNGAIVASVSPIIGLKQIQTNQPKVFSLSQNYPNPFNPVTRIKFELPKSSNVKLVIYDVLGREMETIINDNKKAGTYEIDWDGSRYASGVYFYKLITGDPSTSSGQGYVETKKMVLIK